MDIDVTAIKMKIALAVIDNRVSAAEVLAQLVAECLICDTRSPYHVDGIAYSRALEKKILERHGER